MKKSRRELVAPHVSKYALRVIVGLFTVGALAAMSVGAVRFTAKLTASDLNLAAASVSRSQTRLFQDTQKYASSIEALNKLSPKKVALPELIQAKVLAVCDNGWAAVVYSSLVSQSVYISSLGKPSSNIDDLALPSCLKPEDLGKGQKTSPTLTISDLKVTRSVVKGEVIGGVQEGALIAWSADTDKCFKGQTPVYQVTAALMSPLYASLSVKESLPVTYEAQGEVDKNGAIMGTQTFDIPQIMNGMGYTIGVQGKCSSDYMFGPSTTKNFLQSIPAVSTPTGAWNRRYGLVSVSWVPTSSSPYVTYEVQLKRAYSEEWVSAGSYLSSPASLTLRNYYRNSGDQWQVRAHTIGEDVTSDWSEAGSYKN